MREAFLKYCRTSQNPRQTFRRCYHAYDTIMETGIDSRIEDIQNFELLFEIAMIDQRMQEKR